MENVSSGVGVVLFLKEQHLNLPKEIYSKNVKFSKIKVKVGLGNPYRKHLEEERQ